MKSTGTPTHGTISAYRNGCRCPECRAAKASMYCRYKARILKYHRERNRGKTDHEVALSLRGQVEFLAARIFRSIPNTSLVDLDDLKQVAWIGAMQAVIKFDRRRRIKLSTFAEQKIRGAMLDFLRSLDPLKRGQRKQVKAGNFTAPIFVPLDSAD